MGDLSAVIVEGRGRSRTVALFNMRCDGQQLPESMDGSRVRLFRGRANFSGKAAPWNDGSPGALASTNAEGRAAIAVDANRVFGILTPDLSAEDCIWFSLPLRGLRVAGHGRKGLLKSRPHSIQLGCQDWSVRMTDVNLVIPASGGRQQAGREATLLQALSP
jgi:hypothetical protein